MAKPKPKSQEQRAAELQQMLAAAATSNDMETGGGFAAPAPPILPPAAPTIAPPIAPAAAEPVVSPPAVPASDAEPPKIEQGGENIPAAPAPEPTPPTAVAPEPGLGSAAPTLAPASTPGPAPEPELEPAAEPAVGSAPAAGPAPDESTGASAGPVGEEAPEMGPEAAGAVEPFPTGEASKEGKPADFDLATLFTKSGDKKTWVVRITEAHQEYLALLGTVVGGGASIPDMVHNIVAQYLTAHDADLQRAIQRKLRQRTGRKP